MTHRGSGYIAKIMITMFVLCVIFVPLGIWKLVEISTWCFNQWLAVLK